MRKVVFPPVHEATEDGLVAIGGDLGIDTLVEAYKRGIFPWPVSVELPLAWFSPNPRGVLEFSDLHLSKSFSKFLKKNPFQVTFNQSFEQVIKECARMSRKGQPTTWITPDIIRGYTELFKNDLAYSVEVWNQDLLVGGIYGVCMGNFVSGESMFTKEDNASKLGLLTLIKQLHSKEVTWLDTQMVTPVVEGFGGKYIRRDDFLDKVKSVNWSVKKNDLF